MEVFEAWSLATAVEANVDVMLRIAGLFVSVFLSLRIVIEIYRALVGGNLSFNIAQFVPSLLVLITLIAYKDIMFSIGDGFFAMGEAIRTEGEATFRLTNIWQVLKEKIQIEEGDTFFEVAEKWASQGGMNLFNPLDWAQNLIGMQSAAMWQILAFLFRLGMIFFKNIMYALLLIAGPIPLMLSLIPGLQGMAAHWMKSFLVVGCWNISLALLDTILASLNLQMLLDLFLAGDEELTIAILVAMTGISYLFVPYITSLLIGQTVVSVAGAKLVAAPLSTMASAVKTLVYLSGAGKAASMLAGKGVGKASYQHQRAGSGSGNSEFRTSYGSSRAHPGANYEDAVVLSSTVGKRQQSASSHGGAANSPRSANQATKNFAAHIEANNPKLLGSK